MPQPAHALLYEINTPAFLARLSAKYERPIDLGSVPIAELQALADLGVETVWLMGVWERSPAGIAIALADEPLLESFQKILPTFTPKDLIGSAYCIQSYTVAVNLGGEAALRRFRGQLQSLGIKLMLDFVPNHTAPDHPWLSEHPEYYVHGSLQDQEESPQNFIVLHGTIFANGRDPQYDAWRDVVQLNAFNSGYRQAAIDTLQYISTLCDGVRCDMAMLMLNRIFAHTWGKARAGSTPDKDFWAEVIPAVRKQSPEFVFMAETYWDTERELIKQGFDYCYDKTLYDHLLESGGAKVRHYLLSTTRRQPHMAHFIENHDEPRAAHEYSLAREKAAATLIATLPGLSFLYDGQLEGNVVRLPVHLARAPEEFPHQGLQIFYTSLLKIIRDWPMAGGKWQMLSSNRSHVLAYEWCSDTARHIVVVNYGPKKTVCEVSVPRHSHKTAALNFANQQTSAILPTHKFGSLHNNLLCKLGPWEVLLLEQS